MAKAKKNDIVDKTDDEKTLMEIENINPKKTKSKKISDKLKEDKVKKDKPKPKDKPKDMTEKDLKKELKSKDNELEKVKRLILKINSIME